jgi:benzoyl-CoA reductase subunit C
MMSADPWLPFYEVANDPLGWARSWKTRTGGKVVGHLLPDVPEELIHAAGALPLAIEGVAVQPSHAQASIPGYSCSHAMGALEMGLSGQLGFLDAMVIPYVCDTTRNLFHIWNHRMRGMANEFLRLPKKLRHPEAESYLSAEFHRILDSLGKITGKRPGERDLAASIELYNRSRAALRRAYLVMQRRRPRLWSAQRVGILMASALRAPREDHLAWMESLPWDDGDAEEIQGWVPIYVRGKVWDPPGILSLFDELRLTLVADEVVTGLRSIAQDVSPDGDPMTALVRRHMNSIPYPGYHVKPAEVVTGFLDRVRQSGARGVVFLNPKFCEAAGFETPDLERALQEEGIPSLVLETSARGVSPGQIRVRLEAFREMIGQELP